MEIVLTFVSYAQFTSATLAFLAGCIWFWSVNVRTPESFPIHVVEPIPKPMDPLGAKYIGYGYSSELTMLANNLKTQSARSGLGAVLAGASAFCQVLSFFSEAFFWVVACVLILSGAGYLAICRKRVVHFVALLTGKSAR